MSTRASALPIAREAMAILGRANLASAHVGVDEPVEMVLHRGRHDVVELGGRAGRQYVVKLPGSDAGASLDELRSEIGFYESITSNPAFADLRPIAPVPVVLHRDRPALVIERIDGTAPLAPDSSACPPLDPTVVAGLGRALAVVHAHRPTAPARARARWPRSLDDLRPEDAQGQGVDRMLAVVGEHAERALDELRRQPAQLTLVHGDVRPANVRVRPDASIVLIDWGRAGTGDPARDLAGALHALLQRHLAAMPAVRDRRVLPSITAGALADLRTEARALWDSYSAVVDHADRWCPSRIVALATAVDIIQVALEAAARASVTTAVARALQVACDLAEQPDAVLGTLFGI